MLHVKKSKIGQEKAKLWDVEAILIFYILSVSDKILS